MAARVRRAVARAPFVLYVTEHFLQARYPNHSGVTAGCSDVVLPPPVRAALDRRLAPAPERAGPWRLGVIASLRVRYKGVDTALRALARCRALGRAELELRILGDGDPEPWQAHAHRLGVLEQVRFDGVRPSGDPVMAWLDGLDLYLQPSRQEGLPRSLLEAMSRGCPALGTRCGGIPELLPEEALVAPGDDRGLAERIRGAVADPAWCREQARRNWELATRFTAARLEPRRRAFWAAFAKYARSGLVRPPDPAA